MSITRRLHKREDIASIGITKLINLGVNKYCGKVNYHIMCGILMHSSLAIPKILKHANIF